MTTKQKPLEYFSRFLAYDQETGVFRWVRTSGKGHAGSVAGAPHIQGYVQIGLLGHVYLAHRLAWLFAHGEWPNGVVDHINRDKTDNRIANLRDVTQVENGHNTRIRPDNTSGVKGVSFNRLKGRYLAYVTYRGQRHHCGWHDTIPAASAARAMAERQLGIA